MLLPAFTVRLGVAVMWCTEMTSTADATYGPQPRTRLAPLDVATTRNCHTVGVGATVVSVSSDAATLNVSAAPVPSCGAASALDHVVPSAER